MRKLLIAGFVLASLPAITQSIAQTAKTPFTAVENLAPEKSVRHLSGQELGEGLGIGQ